MSTFTQLPPSPDFDDQGNIIRWFVLDREWVEVRPLRQNTRVDFRGIMVWIKSADFFRSGEALLPSVEWDFETVVLSDSPGKKEFERRGSSWVARLSWTWTHESIHLSVELVNGSDGRWRQIEFAYWAPTESAGSLHGTLDAAEWIYDMPPYGRVKSAMLDRETPLTFITGDGRRIASQAMTPDSRTHFYHRGFCLRMGSGSTASAPEGATSLEMACSVGILPPGGLKRRLPKETIPDLRDCPRPYSTGLMLHLQYTELPTVPGLIERWIPLATRLGFGFILLELDRGLKAHPAATFSALPMEAFRALASCARKQGITLQPMYNLLGHQWETGVLDWQPAWQETEFSGLCPSHPEVRAFASGLIRDLVEAFDCSRVHIGGDELKLPGDGKEGLVCPLCGNSPNLSEVVNYWNFLQNMAPEGVSLAVWGDQFLPVEAIAPGLTGHNWDGRGGEHLGQLDPRIQIFDWQYSAVSPASSLAFLGREGHSIALTGACGESLMNPFIHAAACRDGSASVALHTTWTSPDPRDVPLEGVAAAALAHAGVSYDPERTPERCARLACQMLDELK